MTKEKVESDKRKVESDNRKKQKKTKKTKKTKKNMSAMDGDCPMPYVRAKVYLDYKSEETKLTFERDAKSTKTITKQMEGKTQTIVDVTNEMRTKKVVLKTWGHTGQEDCEHFFEAFEKL